MRREPWGKRGSSCGFVFTVEIAEDSERANKDTKVGEGNAEGEPVHHFVWLVPRGVCCLILEDALAEAEGRMHDGIYATG